MKSTKREKRYYSDTFKLSVIQEIVEGKLSREEARKKYKIGGSSTIIYWMRKFGFLPHLNPKIMPDDKKQEIRNREQHLINENKKLKKVLEDKEIELLVYKEMINIAERDFKIPIKKKHFIKQ